MICLLSRLLFLFLLLSGELSQLADGQSAEEQQCASNEHVEEIVNQETKRLERKQGMWLLSEL